MKLAIAVAAVLGVAKAQDLPSQVFYVPMPETDTFHRTFKDINSVAKGPVTSMVALSIKTEGTVVWYDHWEDGYDVVAGSEHLYGSQALASSTQVWGDGDCSNGSAPGVSCRRGSDDILRSGQSIVLESAVNVPSSSSSTYKPARGVFLWDGGDKVLASFPIAIVRGNYPDKPGSLMAGAIEVLDTHQWGTSFTSPLGVQMYDDSRSLGDLKNGFEHCTFYVMAKEDDTKLTFSDGTKKTLGEGQSFTHSINRRGETLSTTKPVQVDLITGDRGSNYELRWFSLLPRDQWTKSYFSPVGDTKGELKILVFNPNSVTLTVDIEIKGGSRTRRRISAKGYLLTDIIRDGSGAAIDGNGEFIALSFTDTVGGANVNDWGFPVLPTSKLSDEVLIGWGYGCTDRACNSNTGSSVVWVSPVETADIYVDLKSSGTYDSSLTVRGARRLSSNIIRKGTDISGATIWAVKPGRSWDSKETVKIAAAWGQKASYSVSGQSLDLDLGTLIPPFLGISVSETVVLSDDKNGDGKINPGDIVQYTIQVKNGGQKDYDACDYRIKYPGKSENLPFQTYKGSCRFIDQNGRESACNDGSLTSSSGLCSPATLPKRGKIHQYKFLAEVKLDTDSCDISDKGILTQDSNGPDLYYSAPEKVHFAPSIKIEKTVHKGSLGSCSTGEEEVGDIEGSAVTYCYEVMNDGQTTLKDVTVSDTQVGKSADNIGSLAPGASKFVKYVSSIPSRRTDTDAVAVGTPVHSDMSDIETWTGGNVSDDDDAAVYPMAPPTDAPTVAPTDAPTAAPTDPPTAAPVHVSTPAISIEKTVHLGNLASCFDGLEVQYGLNKEVVTYCYQVKNTGDVTMNVKVTDGPVGTSASLSLAPGESDFVRKVSSIQGDATSPGVAVGTPDDGNDAVTDSDPAGVIEVAPMPPCV